MNPTHRPFMAATALLTLGLAACDSSTAPAEDTFDFTGDMALIVADAVAEDLAVMAISLPVGAAVSDAVAASAADFSRTRTRTFFDETGGEMDRFDALLTASINTVTETSGEATRRDIEIMIARERDMTVSGLLGEEVERTWNGTGSQDRSRVRTSDEIGTRSYLLTGTSATTDVVRSLDREVQPWPLSGTIARSIVVEVTNGPNGDETRSVDATLTFNGTRFATLILNGETFEVDLAERGRPGVRRR